jgi:hypothetical protein
MMRIILGGLLAAALLPAAAQTPPQTQTPPPTAAAPAAEAPKSRPPLNLRLNDADLRALTPPADTEKKPNDGLPTLGGKPSPNLERKISDVVPKDQAGGL